MKAIYAQYKNFWPAFQSCFGDDAELDADFKELEKLEQEDIEQIPVKDIVSLEYIAPSGRNMVNFHGQIVGMGPPIKTGTMTKSARRKMNQVGVESDDSIYEGDFRNGGYFVESENEDLDNDDAVNATDTAKISEHLLGLLDSV
jgi:hypothetical protein